MAIPKKGSRRIRVDQVQYRWVARNLTPAGVRVTVQAVEPAGAVLVLRSGEDIAVAHVPPSRVASLIKAARAAGWDSQRPGPPFEMEVAL